MSHPAPEELLLDYAAGVLAAGPALAVALHVALDPAARRAVERLGALGGALMEGEGPSPFEEAPFDEALLQSTLARLDGVSVEPRPAPYVPRPGFEWAPAPLARHLGPQLSWRRVFGGFEQMRLKLPGEHRVSLLRLEPGHGLPMHRHVGEEFTVVLQGGYTDSTGNYGVGDFAVGPGPEEHEPIADPGEPCIALIVVEKPIVLTGHFGRFLNPLVRRGVI
jgi:putative transcriptional regulator